MRALVIALCLLATSACSRGKGPNGRLDRYGKAPKSRDLNSAYDQMSSRFRGKASRRDYVRTMRENRRGVGETAQRLNDGKRGSMEVSAEYEYGLGDQMRLVQEGGDWKISSNPLAFYEQSTPQAALRSFIRAFRLERFDVMLRYVPNSYREK